MKALIFDIETTPLPADQLPEFDAESVLIGNLKDPDKIRAKIEQARAEWLAGAALSPMTGAVAMVGIKYVGGESHITWHGEPALIQEALENISDNLYEGNTVAGFNCFSFDLPFLLRRAWKLGVKVPSNIREGRYWNSAIVDMREVWLMGDRAPAKGTTSLAAIGKFLGLPEKLGNGADFHTLTDDQRREYLTRDLEITEALYRRLVW